MPIAHGVGSYPKPRTMFFVQDINFFIQPIWNFNPL